MKKDGQWLSAHLPGAFPANPGRLRTSPTSASRTWSWLIGEWTHEDKDKKTTVTGRWIKGRKFLVLDYAVHVRGG